MRGTPVSPSRDTRTLIILFLTLLCVGIAYYSLLVRQSEVLYSHFFYVPIALAGLWWGRRGTLVSVILALTVVGFRLLAGLEPPLGDSLFRAAMFVLVGLTVGLLREQAVRSEARLRETNDYLDSLIRYANAPIIVWDPALKITRANQAFERLTGRPSGELVGAPLEHLFPADRREQAMAHVQRTRAGARWEGVELPIQAPDGRVRMVLWNSANIYATGGAPMLATVAQGQDITERLQAEDVLRRTERLTAMGRLAAALAHEINNPLQAIRSHLELVLDFGLERDEWEQYLQVCRQEIERLTGITQRVLSFARPPADTRQRIAVEELARRMLALVGKQLQHANVQVTTDIPDDLPPVLAVPDQIVQVLLNIVINATEVMPDGGQVHIAARQQGDVMVLTFTNNGPPIPPEHLGQIFDPFFSTKPTGTGLGLSISYGIVQAHGGTIQAENLRPTRDSAGGVRFTITLPVGVDARAEAGLSKSESLREVSR
jgi:PAS domain S-box-containing protein